MINLREYFYNKIKNEMDHWDMSDAYSITFFLYSNEAYTYKEYSNVCEFSISLNNETFFKSEYSGDDEGLYSEERWNYAYLEQDDKDMLDEKKLFCFIIEKLPRLCQSSTSSCSVKKR